MSPGTNVSCDLEVTWGQFALLWDEVLTGDAPRSVQVPVLVPRGLLSSCSSSQLSPVGRLDPVMGHSTGPQPSVLFSHLGICGCILWF